MNNNSPNDEAENPPSKQSLYDKITAALASIEEEINLLCEDRRRIDELSANEIEQSLSKYYGMLVRLLTLRVKVEADEPKSYESSIPMFSSIGEPKIEISTAADYPEGYEDDED